jgi:hypothetical protein
VLTAAAEGQFAHEGVIGDGGIKHGIFTWAILDALRNGDRNGNGMIELSELVAHVQHGVPELAAKLGGKGRSATSFPGSTSGPLRLARRRFLFGQSNPMRAAHSMLGR